MKHPRCPTCNHPLHLHTVDPPGCWWMKYTAGGWPCRCGQPDESTGPVDTAAKPLDDT